MTTNFPLGILTSMSRRLWVRAPLTTVYILDEPTTGLAMSDVHQLIDVLLRLRRNGHTVIIIEHHLDVIKCADWVLDLGPGGGERGGAIVAQGTPAEVAANDASHTGQHLKRMI